MSDPALDALRARMHELKDLAGILGLLTWDQETYLALQGGAGARRPARHAPGPVPPAAGRARRWATGSSGPSARELDADTRAMLTVFRRERDHAVRVPESLVRALAEAQSTGLDAWRQARAERAFSRFAPALTRLLELRREQADAIGHGGERYDALLDHFEPEMTTARLLPVLERLRSSLVPLVDALDGVLGGPEILEGRRFDPEQQWSFTLELLELLGFDLHAGRQDRSIHPFTGGTHPTDVRLTTRIDPNNPSPAVFGTLHEFGHGLYEQGFAPEHHRTPLAAAPSMGLHESQSRLWENLVGRSLPFWGFLYPRLQSGLPRGAGRGGAGGLPPRHQPRASLSDPRRGGRGHLQPAHRPPHLSRGPAAPRRACGGGSPRSVELRDGTHRGAPAAGRRRGRAPGHPLGARRVRLFPYLRTGKPVCGIVDAHRRACAPDALGRGGPGRAGLAAGPGCTSTSTATAPGFPPRSASRRSPATGSPTWTFSPISVPSTAPSPAGRSRRPEPTEAGPTPSPAGPPLD